MAFPNLLSPFADKGQQYQNRIVMAAMTRQRADLPGVPNDLMAQYYGIRGDCGLILTEASPISAQGNSFLGAGGIYSEEMAAGWKKVVDAVHVKGAKICLQIYHCGRAATADQLGGQTPICSSPVQNRFNPDYPVPRQMTQEDIQQVLQQFYQAAVYAKKAGFDSIQLHGANGYLIDQFIRDGVNQRTDEYGGSVENRCRFPLQVLAKFCEVYEPQNVGIKLSPVGRFNDMFDSDPINNYSYLVRKLSEMKIGHLEVMEATEFMTPKVKFYPDGSEQMPDVCGVLRPLFSGAYIANNGISLQNAEEMIKTGKCDLVSFAKIYIPNPDLVDRIKNGWELNQKTDYSKLFTSGPDGYSDYPLYADWKKSQS